MAADQKTNLETPPEYRGGDAEPYAREIARWALRYHNTLNPLVEASMQILANIAAVAPLTQTITNPPAQAEVQAIQATLNAIIAAAVAAQE